MFKTYVLHYSKLKDRKIHIEKQLTNQKITDYEFVLDFDKDDLTKELIDSYYEDNPILAENHAKVSTDYINSNYNHSSMQLSSISLCIKWIHAMKRFTNSDFDFGFFVEDDCEFFDNQQVDISSIITNCPKNWDVIFVGGGFERITPIKNKLDKYFLAGHPSTNTTSSLILNKRAANIILKDIVPFYLPIDWEFNHIFFKNDLNVYHLVPYIATQLSNKVFKSTVT